jgi:sugar O-acyltransferase (sialic acid O-acetyltransferase NeuD family)
VTRDAILLLGAGGHARACIDVIEQEGRFVIAGLVGLAHEVGSLILGYPVLGTDDDLPALLSDVPHALVTIGQIKTARHRIDAFFLLERIGCHFPVIVSANAYVSPHAMLGAGTIVMHGAIVNAGAVVGRNCIINSRALVEHDVSIADHCHLATGAVVNGDARIGAGTFVGSGASVRQGACVGEHSVIGMGQRVLADCLAGTRMPPFREKS